MVARYMEHSNDSEFVEYEEIFATFNPSDRAFLKSILDAEGIKYFLQGEHATTYVYHAIPVRLMVRKDQVHKAKEILKDFDTKATFGGMPNLANKKD
jgi:hypothetical protein